MSQPQSATREYALTRGSAGGWLDCTDTTRARRATEADLDFVTDLHSAEFPATYATARHLINDPGLFTFVVERDGVPIGYASGHITERGAGHLNYMAVAPDARGLGDGRILLAATVRAIFAEASVDELRLSVDEDRIPAIRFYEARGFTRVTEPEPSTD